jgi:N-hydroxyarylamine O-acetyltransferase
MSRRWASHDSARSTRPPGSGGPFNYELTFTVVRGEARIGIAHGQAVQMDAHGSFTTTPPTHRTGYLVDELGVSEAMAAQIPVDVPIPPPPGSKTAAQTRG